MELQSLKKLIKKEPKMWYAGLSDEGYAGLFNSDVDYDLCSFIDGLKTSSYLSVGKDFSGREYVPISMEGTIGPGSDFSGDTALPQKKFPDILIAVTTLKCLGYVGPEKLIMICAMEFLEGTCLLPNDAHECFATGTRVLKLSKERIFKTGN
jgi:hypothetical protein